MRRNTISSSVFLLASAIFLILTACGLAPATPGTGIRGLVLLGPLCPVEIEGQPCPDQPYATGLVVTNVDGARELKQFSSNTDGSFLVDVPAGEYAIRSAAAAAVLPYCATNETVIVRPGGYTEAIVYCDTGIR
jgi:hypothetical protein